MQAVVNARAEPGLWLEEVPVPEARGDEVLIRVLKTSICGTDVHIYNWDAWAQKTIPVPMTIGHEFVGVVDLVVVTESFVTFVYFSYSEINLPR
jgi:threonine 3-dehydrogenase